MIAFYHTKSRKSEEKSKTELYTSCHYNVGDKNDEISTI